ncbi:MAG: hypothetical protein IJD04_06310 [Desulfovibrionaceae bacterium]|nr:hypothetical protein [Desulfovibrionaceae bacterium]
MKENMRNRNEEMRNRNLEERRDMGAREEAPMGREDRDSARGGATEAGRNPNERDI